MARRGSDGIGKLQAEAVRRARRCAHGAMAGVRGDAGRGAGWLPRVGGSAADQKRARKPTDQVRP
ncbi:hypothetical protein ACP93_18510 [Xanthomonas sp. NCPPB 1128]|nr:hypothetical protein ACP93_18510 [Xanthomonas sp. NCPPB 1128]